MECFIFPIIIIGITLFWQLFIKAYEKKATKTKIEKEQMEVKSSAKFLCIVGIAETIMLENEIIVPVKGYGKGKYRFIKLRRMINESEDS